MEFFGFLALGFSAGILSGMLGLGGGVVFIPFFHGVLRLPAVASVATSSSQIPFITLAGLFTYWKKKYVSWKSALWTLIFSIPFSVGFAILFSLEPHKKISMSSSEMMSLKDIFLSVIYSITILVIAIWNIKKANKLDNTLKNNEENIKIIINYTNLFKFFILGIIIGFFSSLLGLGGGFFATPYYIRYFNMNVHTAFGTSLAVLTVTSAFSAISYSAGGQVLTNIMLPVVIGGIPGGFIGGFLAGRYNGIFLQRFLGYFQIIILLVYAGLILKSFFPN